MIEPEPIIKYYANGNKMSEKYTVNGKWHRDPLIGPAYISYHKNGVTYEELYFVNGLLHRDPLEGPAEIRYNGNGEIFIKEYSVNENFHNPYGPAVLHIAVISLEQWYLNGIEYTDKVIEYLDKHGFDWQNMDHTDFDIMWAIII